MAGPAAPSSLTDATIRDRSIRLFTFLRELTELRTKATRTIDQYEKVLWVSDIPRDSGCHCAAWQSGGEEESDAWIHIKRPRVPEPPAAPRDVRPWVIEEQLRNSAETPKLAQVIPVEIQDTETGETRTGYHQLSAHPEILRLWTAYVRNEWQPWAEVDKQLRRILAVYTDLFSIYQRQQRLGEAYEVVVGLGYLSWTPPGGHSIRRHLITARTSLTFDAVRGVITVGAAGEGAKPLLEQDMLEANERPDAKEQAAIEAQISEAGDEIWDGAHIFAGLEAWAHAVTPSGEFNKSLERREAPGTRPAVTFAPAVILRKRTERSLIRIFSEIAKQLREGREIPLGIKRVVTIMDDDAGITHDDGSGGGLPSLESQEIYFPDAANDEQLEIVRKLSGRQGVLVQGPPGTGKSHTIANLVAHLLALGQRVLVTSHTARALRVLKDKLADEISDLCVLVLGDDLSAMQSLEDSVHGINEKYDHWDKESNNALISELEGDLEKSRRAEAQALNGLRALREAETYEHTNVCGDYSGTTQAIAKRLRLDANLYSGIAIRPRPETVPPLSNQQALECLRLLREVRSEAAQNDLSTRPIPSDYLVDPQRFSALVALEHEASEASQDFAETLPRSVLPGFSRRSCR